MKTLHVTAAIMMMTSLTVFAQNGTKKQESVQEKELRPVIIKDEATALPAHDTSVVKTAVNRAAKAKEGKRIVNEKKAGRKLPAKK